MSSLRDAIQQQVDYRNFQKTFSTTATVIHYNEVNNTADIEFQNPLGEGTFHRDGVSIAETLGGVCGSGIHDGSKVTIEFQSGNIYCPVITGSIESFYGKRTNTRQGATIVTEDVLATDIPETIDPLRNTWSDEENNVDYKYDDEQLERLYDVDCDVLASMITRGVNHYTKNEQGITNLSNKSTVKIRENGDIDMFVDNNIGIRISKSMQKIYVYGLSVEIVEQK